MAQKLFANGDAENEDCISESTKEHENEALVVELEARVLELSNELKASKSGRSAKLVVRVVTYR